MTCKDCNRIKQDAEDKFKVLREELVVKDIMLALFAYEFENLLDAYLHDYEVNHEVNAPLKLKEIEKQARAKLKEKK